jgi:hypothetical protein
MAAAADARRQYLNALPRAKVVGLEAMSSGIMPGGEAVASLQLDTRQRERQAFFSRLRRDPRFLTQHLLPLSCAAFRKLGNRVSMSFSSQPHGRAKRRPEWLRADAHVFRTPSAEGAFTAALPAYPRRVTLQADHGRWIDSPEPGGDPEDYLAAHRWGLLLVALLEQSGDWQAGIEYCIRWIRSHTDKTDRAWEPYSCCERIANLLVFLALMPPATRADSVPRPIYAFISDSAAWIYRRLEYYGPARTNNHILNNARALVMAGAASGDESAVSTGMAIFRQCLPAMILSGGFLRERSSHYQLVILNWLLDAWRFVAAAHGPECEDAELLAQHARQMCRAASMLCHRELGLLAVIGDLSPDATPTQSVARLELLYPEFWPPPEPEAPAATIAVPAIRDGWFGIRAGGQRILGNFPAGRYPLEYPTHGHGDFTAFVWLQGARQILADPGRYRYTMDAVSLFQLGAAGHCVPLVNGFAPVCESVIANGAWLPQPYASAELQLDCRDGAIVMVHDGFARATPVKRHERRIELAIEKLLVSDSFDGIGEIEIGFCWHFGRGFHSFDVDTMTAAGRDGDVRLSFEGAAGPPIVEPISGHAPGSWSSCAYGERHPSLGVCLRWRARLPAQICTSFTLRPAARS